jgi:hypothetical protein
MLIVLAVLRPGRSDASGKEEDKEGVAVTERLISSVTLSCSCFRVGVEFSGSFEKILED